MDIYRIIATNHETKEAYAELLQQIRPIGQGRAYCTSINGSSWFADMDQIVYDPEIIRKVGAYMYKIRMPRKYHIKPEYLEYWGGDATEETIITDAMVNDFAEEWDVTREELLVELEEID